MTESQGHENGAGGEASPLGYSPIDLSAYPPLMTLSEVQEVLRCSRQTIRRRVSEGVIQGVRTERILLVVRASLQQYVEAHLVAVPTAAVS